MHNKLLKLSFTFLIGFSNLYYSQFNTIYQNKTNTSNYQIKSEKKTGNVFLDLNLEKQEQPTTEKKSFFKKKKKKELPNELQDSIQVNRNLKKDTLSKGFKESRVTAENNDFVQDYEEAEQEIVYRTLPLIYSKEKKKPMLRQMVFMPVKNMHITSPYAYRIHPIFKTRKLHTGVDLRANYDNVYSIMNGIVVEAGYSKGNGNYVAIQHKDYVSYYLHLSTLLVQRNQRVDAGTIIAISGNTGTSTAPHLHFGVKENGRFIDPIQFLNDLIILNNTISTYGNNRQISQR
jgi:murein DD-endopeptidase MepM/ murein hydrolase activator NlpD